MDGAAPGLDEALGGLNTDLWKFWTDPTEEDSESCDLSANK